MNQPTIVAKIHYKVRFEEKEFQLRLLLRNLQILFSNYLAFRQKKNNFKLKYLDDESEFITFIDSFDLTEALELCQTFQPPYLKVFIFEETQEIKNSNMPSLKFSSKNSNSALGSEDLSQLVQIQDKIDSLLQRPYTTYRNRTVQPLWNSQQMTSVSSRNYHKIISQKKKPKIRRNKKKKQKKKTIQTQKKKKSEVIFPIDLGFGNNQKEKKEKARENIKEIEEKETIIENECEQIVIENAFEKRVDQKIEKESEDGKQDPKDFESVIFNENKEQIIVKNEEEEEQKKEEEQEEEKNEKEEEKEEKNEKEEEQEEKKGKEEQEEQEQEHKVDNQNENENQNNQIENEQDQEQEKEQEKEQEQEHKIKLYDPDVMELVEDITMQDGSQVDPKTLFVKTWRIKNTSGQVWKQGTNLQHFEGDQLGIKKNFNACYNDIDPGVTFDINVLMRTPEKEGRYISYWRLVNPEGQYFGRQLWVDLVVKDSSEKRELMEKKKLEQMNRLQNRSNENENEQENEQENEKENEKENNKENNNNNDEEKIVEKPKISNFRYQNQLEQLNSMGFTDVEKIKKLLLKNKGNVTSVIDKLC